MREFKFRICYTDQLGNKYVIYHNKEKPFSHFILLNGDVIEDYGKGVYEVPFDCAEPAFLQQYTGMKDINGKEMYEGDICIYTPPEINIGIASCYLGIYWKENGFFASNDNIETSWILNKGFCDNNLEVVGNIFKNRELLY